MDELRRRRLRRSKEQLPSEDEILEMFRFAREARFRVEPEQRLLTLARRRIRAAAARFGRPVQTRYIRESRMMFGLMPLSDDEMDYAQRLAAKKVNAAHAKAARDAEGTKRSPDQG